MSCHAFPRIATETILCAICVVTFGCSRHHEDEWSRRWPPRYACSGTVLFDGAPLPGAVVTFFIEREDRGNEPFTAVGMTDSEGRFALKTFRPNDGAVSGEHAVMIEKREMNDGALTSHLPMKYARKETSGLVATVTEKGPNSFRFEISSP